MRGVVTGGMLAALDDLDLRSAFDVIYGSSAGAFNAAYFLAGQGPEALRLYFDDMTTTHFYDPLRFIRGQPVVSVDWVLDAAMKQSVPLDWGKVLASPIRFGVIASSITLFDFRSAADLRTALRASARIPLIAGSPVEFRHDRLLDAAVLQTHPYESALANGCTHVLSLSSRPRGKLRPEPGLREWLTSWRLGRMAAGLGDLYLDRLRGARRAQLELMRFNATNQQPPYVLDVAPSGDSHEVALLDRNIARILAGARAGYEACFLALEQVPVRAYFRLTGTRFPRGGGD
jgi:predicted patatin/cPLA2 family phospholipase